jgi:hypothetical protein
LVPESPASTATGRSNPIHHHNHNNLSATKNRLTAYQQRNHGTQFSHQPSPSFVSAGGNSVASSNNSASSPGLFDADNNTMKNGGFTFDAFGLDQSQVEHLLRKRREHYLTSPRTTIVLPTKVMMMMMIHHLYHKIGICLPSPVGMLHPYRLIIIKIIIINIPTVTVLEVLWTDSV